VQPTDEFSDCGKRGKKIEKKGKKGVGGERVYVESNHAKTKTRKAAQRVAWGTKISGAGQSIPYKGR